MADSLRDQLLKSGLVQKLKVETKPLPTPQKPRQPGPAQHKRTPDSRSIAAKPSQQSAKPKAKSAEELDLARAYALRAQVEKAERLRLETAAAEVARQKKLRKLQLTQLLEGKALNIADAEQPRHFPHGNKIRRVYCTPQQLVELNRGELAVVQLAGRYMLVSRETALAVQAIEAGALVLLPDPNAPADDDIPADLVW